MIGDTLARQAMFGLPHPQPGPHGLAGRPEKTEQARGLSGPGRRVTARGKPIPQPDEIPPECGVMLWEAGRLVVARPAPRKPMARMPFHIWLALAKATPVARSADGEQAIF